MANIFNSIRLKRPKRNVFNLSYENKLTMNMGELVPIMCMPIVPGDKFRVNTEALVRLAPLVAPMMHRVNVYTHYFFVPNRLVWNQWEDFITKGIDGENTPVFPKIKLTQGSVTVTDKERFRIYYGDSSLWDYMGLPSLAGVGSVVYEELLKLNGVQLPSGYEVSALPFRAYQLIYNEYYRDQNLTEPIQFSLDGGSFDALQDIGNLLHIRRRAWEKDYFTSALPWLQRGPEVTVPINGGQTGLDVYYQSPGANKGQVWRDQLGRNWDIGATYDPTIIAYPGQQPNQGQYVATKKGGTANDSRAPELDPNGTFKVDVDEMGISIQDLRTSNALQRWFERNARGGSRYIEQIFAHFGVRSSDARLQRPQFLGGGKMPVAVSEVLQTSSTDTTSPQANMAGHGISADNQSEA